jgi:hypothetical protein
LSRVPIVFVMLLYLFFFSLFVLHCYMVLFAVNKPIIIKKNILLLLLLLLSGEACEYSDLARQIYCKKN